MDKTEYEAAWAEGEEGGAGPAESAVKAAAKRVGDESDAEFIRAFLEDEDEEDKDKDKNEKDKA